MLAMPQLLNLLVAFALMKIIIDYDHYSVGLLGSSADLESLKLEDLVDPFPEFRNACVDPWLVWFCTANAP